MIMECCKNLSCCNKISYVKDQNVCPICKEQGILVKNFTVKHIVKEDYLSDIGEDDFYLCTNSFCDVGYYNHKKIIYEEHLKVPIWLKKDANPKYACYCSKVTFDDIFDAVLKKGAMTLNDVVSITNAMKNSSCSINNPTGNCCYDVIKEIYKKALEKKKINYL